MHELGLHVFYAAGESGGETAEYIEASAGEAVGAVFDGISVVELPADEVVAAISARAPFDPDDWELGYSYAFPQLELSLWRPVRPENPDDQEGRTFATVGVGVRGYFSSRSR